MATALNLIYLLSVALWVGSMFFFSFVAAPSIFDILPKNFAGDVVADIFPKYYMVSYICGVLIIITLLIKKYLFESTRWFIYLNLVLVVLMLGISVYAGEVIRPQSSELKKEIRTIKTSSSDYNKLDKKFKYIHLKSVVCNIIVFIFGIAIIYINAYNYGV